MTEHPFRFAVVSSGAEKWTELARQTEQLGYDSLLITDHLDQELAPLPALATAAAVTTTLGLGTYMLGNDFRNPVMLAKEIATLHVLSGQRMQLGLGAGWRRDDYRRTGLTFDEGRIRLRRFTEALRIVTSLLREGHCEFHGEHYDVDVPDFQPVTSRPIPLLVGGGSRHMLTLAAQTADVVSLLPRSTAAGELDESDATAIALAGKLGWVAAAAGQRKTPPELNHVLWECMVTRQPGPILDVFARAMGLTSQQVQDIPSMLIGSVGSVVQTLLERRQKWGLSVITVPASAITAFAPVVEELSGK